MTLGMQWPKANEGEDHGMTTVTKKIGPISAYAIAKEEGYTGTKEQFAQEIGNAAANAHAASESASAAEASAISAAVSAEQAMSGTPEGYATLVSTVHDIGTEIDEVDEQTYNLFDINNATIINGYIRSNGSNSDLVATWSDGSPVGSKTFVIPVDAGKTYTFSRKAGTRLSCACDTVIDTTNHLLTGGSYYTQPGNSATHVTITVPTGCKYLYVWFYGDSTDSSYSATMEEAMLVEGFEVLDYVRYGKQVMIDEGHLSAALQTKIAHGEDALRNRGQLPTGTDLNTVTTNGSYLLLSTNTYTNMPSGIADAIMTVYHADTYWTWQMLTPIDVAGTNALYIRYLLGTTARSSWTALLPPGSTAETYKNRMILESGTDLDSVSTPGSYLVLSTNTHTNKPAGVQNAIMLVVKADRFWTWQMLTPIDGNTNVMYLRFLFQGSARTAWTVLQGGNTYNITQQINQDQISNTYNATISPVFTTDTNGWLQPTGDDTDMSTAIQALLDSTGYCHLAPGTYYVSGNIDMPDGAEIEGCGENTVLRLLDSVNSGYVLHVNNHSAVRGIKFSGGDSMPTNLYTDGSTYGSRHGIVYIGNNDGQEPAYAGWHRGSIIDNCYFENFDGSGIYGRNVGGGINQGLRVSKCDFLYCRVGINLDYYVEYCTFSDCLTFNCHWGCINNGGNNLFTGCIFHGVVGWLLDNSNSDKGNNSHGSCVGCTFNHIDNMQRPSTLGGGLAVHIINGDHGYTFTGCQFWYGNILIENSQGVTFSDSLFGNNAVEIEVTGTYPAFFVGNIFKNAPTVLNVNAGTKFANNWTMSGNVVQP